MMLALIRAVHAALSRSICSLCERRRHGEPLPKVRTVAFGGNARAPDIGGGLNRIFWLL